MAALQRYPWAKPRRAGLALPIKVKKILLSVLMWRDGERLSAQPVRLNKEGVEETLGFGS